MKKVMVLGVVLSLALPAAAHAVPKPFDVLDCVPRDGLRFCEGAVGKTVKSFDGVPIDANVTLPGEGEGPWPLIVEFHGYSGHKRDFDDKPPHEGPKRFASRGYAVLHHTSRGFYGSCGTPEARLAEPLGCATGWLHLDDVRYEIRDAQWLAGLLVDQGIVDPRRIGAFADSYGGAPSLMLALLRDRVVLPDGSYAPWRSPNGIGMELRAAAPYQTWSDLPNALTPNGRSLDYTVPVKTESTAPIGAIKATFVAGLYVTGQVGIPGLDIHGYYAPPGLDPDSNLTLWLPRLLAGEPFDDPIVADVADELIAHHSPLWLEIDREPAPLFLATGGSDDLFTPLEMLRMRNMVQSKFPRATIGFWMGDFGHQRGANKTVDIEARQQRIIEWFDFYVRGIGKTPFRGFEVRTQTCPADVPSLGPFTADRWSALHPGEVRGAFAGPATILSLAGDPTVGAAIDPVAAGNTPCATTPAADQPAGVATFRLPAAAVDWTMIGSPTVVAKFGVTGIFPQLAGRLWDVAPDGSQVLVSRGVLRPRGGGTAEPFQLAPNAYRFVAGHVAKLELMGNDIPFIRPSNGAFTIDVSDLELRLPVHEAPDGGSILAPAAPLLPEGARLAPDLAPPAAGTPKARKRDLRISANCLRGRRIRIGLIGADVATVRAVRIRGRLDRRSPLRLTFKRNRSKRITARVSLRDGRKLTLTRRTPRCR